MKNPFITHPRLVSASINHVRVARLPAVVMDESLVGRSGYELLSTQFLLEKVHRHIVGLRMPRQVMDVLPAFNDCFTHDDPIARISAKQIAVQYGRSLATILLTLKEGHPDNRAARLEWDDSHWAYWRTVKKVWLGGGLMAGKLAPFALDEARRLIAMAGHPDFDIDITTNPGSMTLIGAATAVSPDTNIALLFDFGETRIKRGVGFFENGELKKLHLFSSLPSGCFERLDWGPDDEWAEAQLQHMTAVLRRPANFHRPLPRHPQNGHHML